MQTVESKDNKQRITHAMRRVEDADKAAREAQNELAVAITELGRALIRDGFH